MISKASIFISLIFITNFSVAQNTGFYDYEALKSSLVEYQAEKRFINQLENDYNDSLYAIVNRLVSKSSSILSELDPIQSKIEEEKLKKIADELNAFSKNSIVDLSIRKSALEKAIAFLISVALFNYCEENGMKLLGAKKYLFICRNCKDFTIELVDYIN